MAPLPLRPSVKDILFLPQPGHCSPKNPGRPFAFFHKSLSAFPDQHNRSWFCFFLHPGAQDTTAVHLFCLEIHTYDGNVIKTYNLAEDSHVYDLTFRDNYAKLDVTIAHDDGTETDTIALPGK